MKNGKYRLTAVNIDINQKKAGAAQEISLICFAYFKTIKGGKVAQNVLPKNKKVVQKILKLTTKYIKENEIASVIDVKKTSLPDSIEGVPECGLNQLLSQLKNQHRRLLFEEKKKIKRNPKAKIEVKSEDNN